ncbi:MAG TPA: hypothetical protein VLM75_09345 [Spirochaetota bacterium]|nr:hypothetical protein [Spirochaetota bacterium]
MNRKNTKARGAEEKAICISIDTNELSRFHPLFQEGVAVETDTGISVREFLCASLGIDERYVEERISTIFLNGKPVDDLDMSIIGDGSVLALSAAMPGLVGATMRRGGYYAAMRTTITHRADENRPALHRGRIRLKLFNMILDEIGPSLLQAGVVVRADSLGRVLENLVRDGLSQAVALPERGDEVRLIVGSPAVTETVNARGKIHGKWARKK